MFKVNEKDIVSTINIPEIIRKAKEEFLIFNERTELVKEDHPKYIAYQNGFIAQYIFENYHAENPDVYDMYLNYIIDSR